MDGKGVPRAEGANDDCAERGEDRPGEAGEDGVRDDEVVVVALLSGGRGVGVGFGWEGDRGRSTVVAGVHGDEVTRGLRKFEEF